MIVARPVAAVRAQPAEFLELAVERPLADAEQPGGFLAVAAGELQGLGDVVLLDLLDRLADQGVDAGGPVAPAAGRGRLEVLGQVVDVEHAVGVDHDHALDGVPQLADVARPRVRHQDLAHRRRDRRDRLPCEAANSLRKCSIKSGMSSRRSRSGGSLTLTTLSR